MAGIVLAGGKSQRLGRDKAWERVGGDSLVQRVVSRLAPLTAEIIVVTRCPEPVEGAPGQSLPPLNADVAVRTVSDIYPGRGSVGGIYTGLTAATSFHSVVVACDMPFISAPLLRYMIDLAPGYDVVIPRGEKGLEPLHAVYSRDCLAPIEDLILRGGFRIAEFFPRVKVRYVEKSEIDSFDDGNLSFMNVNAPSDLERARQIAEAAELTERGGVKERL